MAFQLPYDIGCPDVLIVRELRSLDVQGLVEKGLLILELEEDGVTEVLKLAARYERPSRVDLFALVLCKRRGCTLVTGDGPLREAADKEGVTVHGLLWLLDRMVEHAVLCPSMAYAALQTMLDKGARLPRKEVDLRLTRWGGQ